MRAAIYTAVWALLILALAAAVVFRPSHARAAEIRACHGQMGIASWYSYSGHRTANGERFPTAEPTVAHRSLPFNTVVTITDQVTGRRIRARVNDRGPFVRGRIVDLSPAARRALGMGGLARVCISEIN